MHQESPAAYQKSGKFWSKVKSSTKSFSSSFSQLSLKQERDGDTPTSTVVHKALVKFYSTQEPFQGFPDWLGHKEDLPDEQKVLRKQKHHSPTHSTKPSEPALHLPSTCSNSAAVTPTPRTAGTDFRGIYKSSSESRATSVDYMGSRPLPRQSQDASRQENTAQLPPPTQRTSSMLMRERLKRK
ncbi:Protein MSO1 [Lachancea thermotolerans]|uniref:KLTH0A07568p n=1 Tax=Lachancea thermotolerans (strain ATCC 56472 / CBS 6340 / NRRL Y-8284) TaxID=559295 RepID=C5DC39_LACTC|nr:KLTH0A07568p [Lachancea thermotolerans CBS 6340]CAR21346.1 KLTH0A07568p [Lachancea thermotolerans CBS 6340]